MLIKFKNFKACFTRLKTLHIVNSSDDQIIERLPLESESGQINHFKIDIHSFPTLRSAITGPCGEQAGRFTCAVEKRF